MDQKKKYLIAYGELLNRCWDDPEYLAKFKADPAAALEDFGIETVPGARYHIVAPEDMKQSTMEDIYLFYMDNPDDQELDEEMIGKVAGGGFIITKSNIVTNGNVLVDAAAVAETLAGVVTVSVAVTVG